MTGGCGLQLSLVFMNPLMDTLANGVLDPAQKKISGQSGFLSKHKEKRGLSRQLMGSSIVAIEYLW